MSKLTPLLKTLLNRKSIRKFKGIIPDEDINTIVKCGQRAPTTGGAQLCTLIEIKNQDLREAVTKVCHNQEFINEASHFFVICADVRRIEMILQQVSKEEKRPLAGTLKRLMSSILDATLVAHNMVIAAEELGYGSVYVGSINAKIREISELLDLPKGVLPVVGLTLGIPAETPPLRPRIPLEMIWQIDGYEDPSLEDIEQAITIMDEALDDEGYFEIYYNLKKLYAETSEGVYTWSQHMNNKFWVDTKVKLEQAQKEALQRQGFVEYF